MDLLHSGFELPIRITYREPRWLPAYQVSLHLGALISVFVTGLPCMIKVPLVIYISASLVFWLYARRYRNSRYKGLKIHLNKFNDWILQEHDTRPLTVKLISARILLPSLIMLKLKNPYGKRYDLLLTSECVDDDTMRRLRVRLYWPISTSGSRAPG